MYRVLLAMCATVLATVSLASPATAAAEGPQSPQDRIAKAYVLVDADTGNIIERHNDRVALPPASITKLLTALTVLARMDAEDEITVTTNKAESMPALKVGVRQGETWTVDRLLRGLLMVSANDAAVALAEGSTGSLENFVAARAEAAKDLGLADNPTFNDPAGLDDDVWGYNGGDKVSARDMAIIARAALADGDIRSIVSSQRYDFIGLDAQPHHFLNHNALLKTYPGAIGMKTGYTKKAGRTLVAAAQRDGRTMIVVLLNSPNTNLFAAQLLDRGFATPVSSQNSEDQVPLGSVEPTTRELAGDKAPVVGSGTPPSSTTIAAASLSEDPGSTLVTGVIAAGFIATLLLLILHHWGEPMIRRLTVVRWSRQRSTVRR